MIKITSPEIQEYEKKHRDTLRQIAPECMVLLKKNGDFPLNAPCEIALYGAGARQTIKGGTGSGDVYVRYYASIEEALETAGFTVTTKRWLDAYDVKKREAKAGFYENIQAKAKAEGKPTFMLGFGKLPPEPSYEMPIDGAGEVCIYVLSRNSGEGSDRRNVPGDYTLSAEEERDILLCARKYRRFILVLNTGGPVDISPVTEEAANILLLGQLGMATGEAFADVILGKAYPSGKLAATWLLAADLPLLGEFAEEDDTRYREGIFVGYRLFDASKAEPLFPFAYGLGYTDFSVEVSSFSVLDGSVSTEVTVTNIGKYPGRDVVHLFYSAPQGRLCKSLRELGAFAKTRELLPGESETLSLCVPLEDLASWDTAQAAWLLEKGNYTFYLGEAPVGAIELGTDVITQRLSPMAELPDFEDEIPAPKVKAAEGIPVIHMDAESVSKSHFDRNRVADEALALPDLSDASDEELALICTGKFKEGGLASIVGNSSFSVAGAAGETADTVRERGFGSMVLADGPAGVRIATKYLENGSNVESLDSGSFEELIELLPEAVQAALQAKKTELQKRAENETVYYHYASAIPVGTALAQSWNTELGETCGELVGEEMERFGVNVWLAPALNIQRNPLCGRNFEYYSEDPLVSGKMAAAITRGVQKRKNCAVTVKHFACNNQETNRFGSNSIVSERALREIYLKGFEICVKESAPHALMTSYNLLNGTHTANSYWVLTEVLRKEWGYEGIVMSDWGTTGSSFNLGKHPCSSAAMCIGAGNDLIMPGSKQDVDEIVRGVGKEFTREELERCAGRVLAMARRLWE